MDETPRRPRTPDDDDRPRRRPRTDDDRPPRRREPEALDRLEEVPDDESYGVSWEQARPAREWDAGAPKEAPRRRRRDEDEEDDRPRSRRRSDEEDDRPRRKKRPATASVPQMDFWLKVGLWGGLAAVVVLGLGTWWLVRTVNRAPFRPHLPAYLAGPMGVAGQGTPVRKVVVVDVKDRDIDGLQFDLPPDLRPANAGEVTTVVWVSWDKRQVATYTTGGAAYKWFCDVTVFDLSTRGQIAKQQFQGTDPPATFYGKRGESRSGDKPTDAILNFLRGLKR
jgi:hypothetical protein